MLEVLHQSSINAKEQLVLNRSSTWMDEVIKYLSGGELPEDHKEVERVKHKSRWFCRMKTNSTKSPSPIPAQVCNPRGGGLHPK